MMCWQHAWLPHGATDPRSLPRSGTRKTPTCCICALPRGRLPLLLHAEAQACRRLSRNPATTACCSSSAAAAAVATASAAAPVAASARRGLGTARARAMIKGRSGTRIIRPRKPTYSFRVWRGSSHQRTPATKHPPFVRGRTGACFGTSATRAATAAAAGGAGRTRVKEIPKKEKGDTHSSTAADERGGSGYGGAGGSGTRRQPRTCVRSRAKQRAPCWPRHPPPSLTTCTRTRCARRVRSGEGKRLCARVLSRRPRLFAVPTRKLRSRATTASRAQGWAFLWPATCAPQARRWQETGSCPTCSCWRHRVHTARRPAACSRAPPSALLWRTSLLRRCRRPKLGARRSTGLAAAAVESGAEHPHSPARRVTARRGARWRAALTGRLSCCRRRRR
eukprot:Rhum_TRINITY_DN9850_c0_g1::Rhum_TRINITY_DN9850_c0_g1_i1::g.35515::m.35515